MMPNMNPRQMKRMMRQLGMKMDEIPASEVRIKKQDGSELVIQSPQVTKMTVQGQETYQVVGTATEGGAEESTPAVEVSEEDVQMIVSQTSVSEEEARKKLEETGDLAKAILELEEKQE